MKHMVGKCSCLIVIAVCATASGQFVVEDFDAYPIGSIDAQGPWVDFGGVNLTEVSSDFAHSGDKSMKLTLSDVDPNPNETPGYGSDVFLDMPVRVRGGKYLISYWTYIPTEFNGENHAFFSEGLVGAGDFDLGTQLVARGNGNEIVLLSNGESLPLIRNEWVEARQEIDFDANTVRITYGGDLLFEGEWDDDQPIEGDFPQFRGVNFWVEGAVEGEKPLGSMYIDDVRFVPEPTVSLIGALGVASLIAASRRRRT